VSVGKEGDDVVIGEPELLFEGDEIGVVLSRFNGRPRFDTQDGETFIVIRTLERPTTVATVMTDWIDSRLGQP
jgi:hypothetical protein